MINDTEDSNNNNQEEKDFSFKEETENIEDPIIEENASIMRQSMVNAGINPEEFQVKIENEKEDSHLENTNNMNESNSVLPSGLKRKHNTLEEDEKKKSEKELHLRQLVETVFQMFQNKETNWKEEFKNITNLHVDITNDILPRSLNNEGSFLLSLSPFWIMLIQIKTELSPTEQHFKEDFLSIFNNATEYPIDNKFILVDFFVKFIEANFSLEEILNLVNFNPLLLEKKKSVYDISKDDYKYLVFNPDFFTIIVPRPSGKKMKKSHENVEETPKSRKNVSRESSNFKRSASVERAGFMSAKSEMKVGSSPSEVKFEADINYPEDIETHHQLKLDESLHEVKDPIPEEKVEDEVINSSNNNITNNSIHTSSKTKNKINDTNPFISSFENKMPVRNDDFTVSYVSNSKSKPIAHSEWRYNDNDKPKVSDLRREIINSTYLAISRDSVEIAPFEKKKNLKSIRSNSFSIIPQKNKNKKRISFINIADDEEVEQKENKESKEKMNQKKNNNDKNKKKVQLIENKSQEESSDDEENTRIVNKRSSRSAKPAPRGKSQKNKKNQKSRSRK